MPELNWMLTLVEYLGADDDGYETQKTPFVDTSLGINSTPDQVQVIVQVGPIERDVTLRGAWLWINGARAAAFTLVVPETYRPGPMRKLLDDRPRWRQELFPRYTRDYSGNATVAIPTWMLRAHQRVEEERRARA